MEKGKKVLFLPASMRPVGTAPGRPRPNWPAQAGGLRAARARRGRRSAHGARSPRFGRGQSAGVARLPPAHHARKPDEVLGKTD
jgi:hypothetical protein